MFDRKEYQKQYYERNKGKISEYYKQYYKQHYEENPLKYVWGNIKQRCYNPNYKDFKNYGGRGIVMCNEWLDNFEVFEKWCVNSGYKSGLEIDRIDNNGNYHPDNCQFVTAAENLAIGKKRKQTNNKSEFVGVSFYKPTGKYQAVIYRNRKKIFLGLFTTPEEACEARIEAELFYFKEQRTNFHYVKK